MKRVNIELEKLDKANTLLDEIQAMAIMFGIQDENQKYGDIPPDLRATYAHDMANKAQRVHDLIN